MVSESVDKARALYPETEFQHIEAVASSLTEMFSPMIIGQRVKGMLENYDFITEDILRYFGHRLSQAPRDADWALDYVKKNALSEQDQEAALDALKFKCGMLWTQLDALEHVYVNGNPCPGAWQPGEAIVAAAA